MNKQVGVLIGVIVSYYVNTNKHVLGESFVTNILDCIR